MSPSSRSNAELRASVPPLSNTTQAAMPSHARAVGACRPVASSHPTAVCAAMIGHSAGRKMQEIGHERATVPYRGELSHRRQVKRFGRDAKTVQRQVRVDHLDRRRQRCDQGRQAAGRNDPWSVRAAGHSAQHPPDHPVDRVGGAEEHAAANVVVGGPADGARRRQQIGRRELGGAADQLVGRGAQARHDRAADEAPVGRDAIECGGRAKPDDDAVTRDRARARPARWRSGRRPRRAVRRRRAAAASPPADRRRRSARSIIECKGREQRLRHARHDRRDATGA